VVVSASTVTASPLNASTVLLRLLSDVDCRVAVGSVTGLSATATSTALSAGSPEYVRVPREDDTGTGIGVATWGTAAGGAGTLNITEMR
jgi:hypothetical protein